MPYSFSMQRTDPSQHEKVLCAFFIKTCFQDFLLFCFLWCLLPYSLFPMSARCFHDLSVTILSREVQYFKRYSRFYVHSRPHHLVLETWAETSQVFPMPSLHILLDGPRILTRYHGQQAHSQI